MQLALFATAWPVVPPAEADLCDQ